jgi:hypothetical protein
LTSQATRGGSCCGTCCRSRSGTWIGSVPAGGRRIAGRSCGGSPRAPHPTATGAALARDSKFNPRRRQSFASCFGCAPWARGSAIYSSSPIRGCGESERALCLAASDDPQDDHEPRVPRRSAIRRLRKRACPPTDRHGRNLGGRAVGPPEAFPPQEEQCRSRVRCCHLGTTIDWAAPRARERAARPDDWRWSAYGMVGQFGGWG